MSSVRYRARLGALALAGSLWAGCARGPAVTDGGAPWGSATACGPATCSGCCQGDVCIPPARSGTSSDTCGINGARCVLCAAPNRCEGVCLPRSGAGGGAGGGGMGGGATAGLDPTAPGAQRASPIVPWETPGTPPRAVFVNPEIDRLFVVDVMATLSAAATASPLDTPLPIGSRPSSVALRADGVAFVALRGLGQIARVNLVNGGPLDFATVGTEPVGVALTDDGATLVVVHAADPLVALVDTSSLAVRRLPLPGVARAVAVTGTTAWVPLFYGTVVAEASDRGRFGEVLEVDVAQGAVRRAVTLFPIDETARGEGVCAPNQLAAIEVVNGRGFVAHTCVSPSPPLGARTTAMTAVSLFDVDAGVELPGSASMRTLLAPAGAPLRPLLANPVALAVSRGLLHLLSAGTNQVATFSLSAAGLSAAPSGPALATPCGYGTCPGEPDGGPGEAAGVPSGFAILKVPLPLVDPFQGTLVLQDLTGLRLSSADGMLRGAYALPGVGGAPALERLKGLHSFRSAQDRWSSNGAMSCESCHPDGRADGVTWVFSAGPRQTIPLDGTFNHADPTDHRAQNWTALFDEVYDVEGLARGLMGGLGAITALDGGVVEVPLALSTGRSLDGGAVARSDGLSGSSRALSETLSVSHAWNELERFVQTLPAPRAPSGLDPRAVARGRAVFASAGCAGCHGGPRWSSSRVPYVPSPERNGSVPGDNGLPAAPTGLRTELRPSGPVAGKNLDTLKVAPERLANPDGGAELVIGPERLTCVLRTVGTFDAQSPLEKKADGTRAQGALGYNVPSLFGLAASAPYLHHGAAATLETLFAPPFLSHARAGNAAFLPGGGAGPGEAAEVADLASFLRSIDEGTPPFALDPAADLCGGY